MIEHDRNQDKLAKSLAPALAEARLVSAVMRRLGARSRLSRLAEDTCRGMASAQVASAQLYVGEAASTACGSKQTQTVNFQCSAADFTCAPETFPGGFNCGTSGYPTFNCSDSAGAGFNCAGKGAYNCGGADGSQVFNCTESVYDCYQFDCATGDGCGFQCSTQLDFLCDASYGCDQVFDCTSGHVFFCNNLHGCETNFGCSADATGLGPNPPYNPPGQDGNPGDFLCGTAANIAPQFNCWTYFMCNGSDDFDCNQNAKFGCGDASNNTGNFSCQAGGTFACDSQVTCSGAYSGCPSSTTQYSAPPPS